MEINNLSSRDRELLMEEIYPISKIVNETILSIEDLKAVAEFCTASGYWGSSLKKLLLSINPRMVDTSDDWFIDKDELMYNIEMLIKRNRLWLNILNEHEPLDFK